MGEMRDDMWQKWFDNNDGKKEKPDMLVYLTIKWKTAKK